MTRTIIITKKERTLSLLVTSILQTAYDSILPFAAGWYFGITGNAWFLLLLLLPVLANWDILTKKVTNFKN